MCDRGATFAIVIALLVAHCAWTTPGVGVEMTIASDDAPGEVLDARGAPHVIESAALRIASITLLRCPDDRIALLGPDDRIALRALLGPALARAHDDESAALGPIVLDATDPTPVALGRLVALPGRYCDARVRVAPEGHTPSLVLRTSSLTITSTLERERVVRLAAPLTLDEDQRTAHLALRVSLGTSLARVDPSAPDELADGAAALTAILATLTL